MSLRISPGVVDFIHGLTSTRFIFAINQNQLNYLRKTGASLLALAETIYYQEWLDDTTVFLRNQESMNVLLELLEKFERCSGLKINPTKSEAIWLGKWKNREDTLFNFKWPKESVFVLGVHFSNCKRTCDKLNFYDKLDALENTLNNWKRRKLTLLGKISIVKSLGLSKLIFIASVFPVPEKFCDQVNKITFTFIWDNKIAKMKRNTCQLLANARMGN